MVTASGRQAEPVEQAAPNIDERAIQRFLYLEARLADQHDYDGWEALWTDDAVYWVPGADDSDPLTRMSIIHDNRHRIGTRIKQLKSGRRHAQDPPSRLTRTVSNIEVFGPLRGAGSAGEDLVVEDLVVEANFMLLEARERSYDYWGGRTTYRLRETEDGLAMSYKKVDLVNRPWVVPTLAFLI